MNTSRNILFKSLVGSLLIFSLSNCQSENKPKEIQTVVQDSIPEEEIKFSAVSIPDMAFDIENFGDKGIKNNTPLSKQEREKLQIKQFSSNIDEHDKSFNYYLLQELYKGSDGKIVLISRTAEMESYAWLVSYDNQEKYIDSKTVFYDEWAEGLFGITSTVSDNKITIAEYQLLQEQENEQESIKTDTFTIDALLKFIKEDLND